MSEKRRLKALNKESKKAARRLNSSQAKLSSKIKRERLRRLLKTASKAYAHKKRGDYQAMADAIINDFVSFGGVYVKFLQGIMLQSKTLKTVQPKRS